VKRDRDVERALSRVLAEAKSESVPKLDWARIESRLDAEPALPEIDTRPSRSVRSALILAAAGVALALGWVAAGGHGPIASPSPPDAAHRAIDGDMLATGERIDAAEADVAVEHRHHSQWTLERGGRANVTTEAGVVRVELEQGALVARVVPSPRKETFVVEAAGTRVAVHGTAFRVALTADRVDVSVTEGTVLVGPRDRPGWGQPLTANQGSGFTLTGTPLDDVRSVRSPTSRPAADHRPLPNAGHARELVAQPPIDEVERAVSEVLGLSALCFETRTTTRNGVRVTASTKITLHALPEGKLELVSLDPPLAPPVQACVSDGIRNVSITESQHGIQITRQMDLER
jgi:ferric-dicitrate binding protein FerR (iron transport regulator)